MKAAKEVTFPWNDKTMAIFGFMRENGIGCLLDIRGLTVELAEGCTEDDCRRAVAQKIAQKPQKPKRRQKV